MSTEEPTKEAAPPRAQSSKITLIAGMILPAVLSGGAAFGGARAAGAHAKAPEATEPAEVVPPGPTVTMEPFLVTVFDGTRKAHPMKMSIAVEFKASAKDDVRTFVPRMRDGMLAHVRASGYEQVTDPAYIDQLRTELLERCRQAGATNAERVLVTDLVVQ